jgi:hypothetical protein
VSDFDQALTGSKQDDRKTVEITTETFSVDICQNIFMIDRLNVEC